MSSSIHIGDQVQGDIGHAHSTTPPFPQAECSCCGGQTVGWLCAPGDPPDPGQCACPLKVLQSSKERVCSSPKRELKYPSAPFSSSFTSSPSSHHTTKPLQTSPVAFTHYLDFFLPAWLPLPCSTERDATASVRT